ncbi:MAG: TlpA family protein disulfide reductase [Gemmatimonadetes bacterium]|nr:TlpA family protein disulfide reductase [Gemmatimonadota bacterium]
MLLIALVALGALGLERRWGSRPPGLTEPQVDTLVSGLPQRPPRCECGIGGTHPRGLSRARSGPEYWATWCGPCSVGLRDLQQLRADYAATDLAVVAVSIDPRSRRDAVRREVERAAFSFDVLHDLDRHSERVFPVWGVPMSFLIDRRGRCGGASTASAPMGSAPTGRGPRPERRSTLSCKSRRFAPARLARRRTLGCVPLMSNPYWS